MRKLGFKTFAFSIAILMILTTAFIRPLAATATADAKDKSKQLQNLQFVFKQGGAEIASDKIDWTKPFNLQFAFSFAIVDNRNLEAYKEQGKTAAMQVDEGDYAEIVLGKNFSYKGDATKAIPVYLATSKQTIGNIVISKDNDGVTKAKIKFQSLENDPKGKFNYEQNAWTELTVSFEAPFAADTKPDKPDEPVDHIQVLDKNIPVKLPADPHAPKATYSMNKSGTVVDEHTASWTLTPQGQKNNKQVSLAGLTIKEDLSQVGDYIADTFTVNGQKVKPTYDAANKLLTYTLTETDSAQAATPGQPEIKFNTQIIWSETDKQGKSKKVENTALLLQGQEQVASAAASITVERTLTVTKKLAGVEEDKNTHDQIVNWTVDLGKDKQKLGNAWIIDTLLIPTKANLPKPKATKLTLQRKVVNNGKEGLQPVTVNTVSEIPAQPDKTQAYNVGEKAPQIAIPKDKKLLQATGIFLPEMTGEYVLQISHVFAPDVNLSQAILLNADDEDDGLYKSYEQELLKNIATVTVGPKDWANKPLPQDAFSADSSASYQAAPTLTKTTINDPDADDLRQGILPWEINLEYDNMFPSKDGKFYEIFYYGDYNALKADYKSSKGLQAEGFDSKVLNTYFRLSYNYGDDPVELSWPINWNIAYVKNSFASTTLNLDKIVPLKCGDKKVGEILVISPKASEQKALKHEFTLKTQLQNLLSGKEGEFSTAHKLSMQANNHDVYLHQRNTVVFSGDPSLKNIQTSEERYHLEGDILSKRILPRNVDLENVGSINNAGADQDKLLDCQDHAIYFRVTVNAMGINFADYQKTLVTDSLKDVDFSQLVLKDKLPAGWKIAPIKGQENFVLYQAQKSAYKLGQKFFFSGLYDNSNGQYQYGEDAQAVKRLSAAEAAQIVDFTPNTATWKFKNYNSQTYILVYKLQVPEADFAELLQNSVQGDNGSTMSNEVELSFNDKLPHTAKCDFDAKMLLLEKTVPTLQTTDKGNTVITWKIDYRPYTANLEKVELIDTLDKNVGVYVDAAGQVDLSKFKITCNSSLETSGYDQTKFTACELAHQAAAGKVVVTYDRKQHQLHFVLPQPANDKKIAYHIEYETSLVPTDLTADTISNKVNALVNGKEIKATGQVTANVKTYAAWADMKKGNFFVFAKTNAKDAAIPVADAQYVLKQGDKVLHNYTTNAAGRIYIFDLADGDYVLQETVAPKGYKLNSEPLKFSLQQGKLKLQAANVSGTGKLDSPIGLSDEPQPQPQPQPQPGPGPAPQPGPGPAPQPGPGPAPQPGPGPAPQPGPGPAPAPQPGPTAGESTPTQETTAVTNTENERKAHAVSKTGEVAGSSLSLVTLAALLFSLIYKKKH